MVENRDKHLTLRVTESDRALVRAAARKEGVRVSEFLRATVVTRALEALARREASS